MGCNGVGCRHCRGEKKYVMWGVARRGEGVKPNWPRKQNLQTNSRSAYQFWHKRDKEAYRLLAKLYICSLAKRANIKLIFALRAAVSEIRANFQNSHIRAWHLAFGKSSWSCTYVIILLFTPGVEIQLIFSLRAAVSEILTYFQNCHIWAWNLGFGKSSRSCTYIMFLLFSPGVEIEVIFFFFALQAAVSEILADFQNCHIWVWNLAFGRSPKSCTHSFFLP